jgi:hypothetical protein
MRQLTRAHKTQTKKTGYLSPNSWHKYNARERCVYAHPHQISHDGLCAFSPSQGILLQELAHKRFVKTALSAGEK